MPALKSDQMIIKSVSTFNLQLFIKKSVSIISKLNACLVKYVCFHRRKWHLESLILHSSYKVKLI